MTQRAPQLVVGCMHACRRRNWILGRLHSLNLAAYVACLRHRGPLPGFVAVAVVALTGCSANASAAVLLHLTGKTKGNNKGR